jgi:hypothetical protein
MNMTLRKLKPAPIDADDVLAVLQRKLGELQARRDAITKQIIGFEKTAVHTPENRDLSRAEALLDGEPFVVSRDRPMSQLAVLHAERNTIDEALKIGRSRAHQLEIERATEIWVAHFPEIAEIEKRRVMLALQLQKTNREREKLRETITNAGGAGYLSTDGVGLLGIGDLGDSESEVVWASERLIADGICTRAEIERAKNDG